MSEPQKLSIMIPLALDVIDKYGDDIFELVAIQVKEEFDRVASTWGPDVTQSVRYQKGFAFAPDTVNILVSTEGVRRV